MNRGFVGYCCTSDYQATVVTLRLWRGFLRCFLRCCQFLLPQLTVIVWKGGRVEEGLTARVVVVAVFSLVARDAISRQQTAGRALTSH